MSASRPSCAVVVCAFTEQRLDDLRACVGSVLPQLGEPDRLVVVVDNHPTLAATLRDDLLRGVIDHTDGIGRVHVVDSDAPRGLSHARNAGITHARTVAAREGRPAPDVIAIVDDDAVAAADWLDALLAPFADPAVVAVGGRIDPAWPQARPEWFPPHLDWTVGCTNPGTEDRSQLRNVFGANAAFQLAPLLAAGGFPTALGRVGDDRAGCEETELCIRLRALDPSGRVVHAADAVVHHRVTPSRATVRYVLSRCFAEGRSKARLAQRVGHEHATSDERSYAVDAARAAASDVRSALRHPRAIARAGVLAGGFASAAAGFVREHAAAACRSVGAARAG